MATGITHFNKISGVSGVSVGKSGAEIEISDSTGQLKSQSIKLSNTFIITETLQSGAATAANYGVFFIAPFACEVVSVQENHTTAGSDPGAVTLDIEKLTGTQASGAGAAVLGATKINLKEVAETVQAPALTATTANKQLSAGDKLNILDVGVLTAVAGVAVTVQLKKI